SASCRHAGRCSALPKAIFPPAPARPPPSPPVSRSAIPPVIGAAPAVVESFPACSVSPEHWPAALTRSAAVTGRNAKSFLPPEKVAQSGLRSSVSGLGTSVTLLRLRSDEHADTAEPSAVIASTRKIWLRRCNAVALTPTVGLDRRACRPRFCVSTLALIFSCFPLGNRQHEPARPRTMALRLLRSRPRLSDT